MITEVKGRFSRVKNGLTYAASVTILVSDMPAAPDIIVRCSGTGWLSQGSIEDVSATGYEDWKQGAVIGVRHALTVAGKTDCHVTITQILGQTADTNPTVVSAAAMNTVWEAIGYAPSPDEVQQVEQIVFASSQYADDSLPHY